MSRRPAAARRRGRHARPPAGPAARRFFGRPPLGRRLLAIVLLAAFAGGGLTLVRGPWLRVERVVYAGQRYTPSAELEAIVAPLRGTSLLTVDSEALSQALAGLPAVASAQVSAHLPTGLAVTVEEKAATFIWQTVNRRLLGAADGSLFAAMDPAAEAPADLAGLPVVVDERTASAALAIGDTINLEELRMATRMLALDPTIIGSEGTSYSVRIADQEGLVLVSAVPAWQAAFGVYGLDPTETVASNDERFDQQVAAVRTLFATTRELNVSWVDVRNPGKVYWRP